MSSTMNTYRQVATGAVTGILKDGEKLSLWIRGDSMIPMLKNGDHITVVPVRGSNLRIGDILVYESGGELITHRLIRIARGYYHIRGDASTKWEIVTADQLRGKVVAAERAGRDVKLHRLAGLWSNYFHQAKRFLARRFPVIYGLLRNLRNAFLLTLFFICVCRYGEALELKIPFALVQKQVEAQMFTEGRSYLSGDKTSTCEFAYLENPVVMAQQGRLGLQARFHGKAGREVLGKCIGVGKSFDIVITGRPVSREGVLRFEEAQVQFKNEVADAVFGELLEEYAEDLERDLKFPLQADVKQLSETLSGSSGYKLRVERFSVSSIDVLTDAIRLQIDTSILLDQR